MSIEIALKEAEKAGTGRSAGFQQQLAANRQFADRMQQAGVVTVKQGFTIPLMQRISLTR